MTSPSHLIAPLVLRKILSRLTRPIARSLLGTIDVEDPWHRFEHGVPTDAFGRGSRNDFTWYLEGESSVTVHSISEISDWLADCDYISDPELFREDDYWQHPCTFERLRMGDCEDFALWAWRKLRRLGIYSEFVAGRLLRNSKEPVGHAWVVIHDDEVVRLLDAPGCKDASTSLRTLDSVRSDYLPEVSIDTNLNRYVYGGYYLIRQK